MTDKIDVNAVHAALAPTLLGGQVLHFPEVDSTQSLALVAARSGVTCGVWVADAQTAGRGRGGHTWHSAPGDGLYVSVLFTPREPSTHSRLPLVAALCAWSAIREVTGITVDIRWPNDLVTLPGVHPRARKLGGVLVESAARPLTHTGEAPTLRYAVVGIGLNVGHMFFPPELQDAATSLRLEGWRTPQRQSLLIALLCRLVPAVQEVHASVPGSPPGPGPLPEIGEVSTWITGKYVHVSEDGGYTGVTDGLNPQGFLQVRTSVGDLRTVRAGGVREA